MFSLKISRKSAILDKFAKTTRPAPKSSSLPYFSRFVFYRYCRRIDPLCNRDCCAAGIEGDHGFSRFTHVARWLFVGKPMAAPRILPDVYVRSRVNTLRAFFRTSRVFWKNIFRLTLSTRDEWDVQVLRLPAESVRSVINQSPKSNPRNDTVERLNFGGKLVNNENNDRNSHAIRLGENGEHPNVSFYYLKHIQVYICVQSIVLTDR